MADRTPVWTEREERLNYVIKQLTELVPRHLIVKNIRKEWGITARQAALYMKEAREKLAEIYAVERKEMLLDLVTQTETVAAMALKQKNTGAALAALQFQAKMTGLLP